MKIEIKRIDHVQLVIPGDEIEAARKFYGELLGFEEIEKPGSLKQTGGVWYKIGNSELHLGIEKDGTGRTGLKKEHPAFEITGLKEVKKYLAENRVNIKEEIPIPGRKRFSIYDPFGNRIEFLEYITTRAYGGQVQPIPMWREHDRDQTRKA
jgi:catechol 2,3-dioxygenase-like lactoylglutathione lyase family enzyme